MTEWTRVEHEGGIKCGACGVVVLYGSPIHVISIAGVKQKKFRCEECAGEAPADLPASAPPSKFDLGFVHLAEAAPKRTRGALRSAAGWMPYRDD